MIEELRGLGVLERVHEEDPCVSNGSSLNLGIAPDGSNRR